MEYIDIAILIGVVANVLLAAKNSDPHSALGWVVALLLFIHTLIKA